MFIQMTTKLILEHKKQIIHPTTDFETLGSQVLHSNLSKHTALRHSHMKTFYSEASMK